MKDLYYFGSKYLSISFRVESNEDVDTDRKLIKANYEGINFPVTFKQVDGKKFTDILTAGVTSQFLISKRLEKILSENSITGWKTYPIFLIDKKGNKIDGYSGFSVTGISGRQTYLNSPIIETRYVPEGPIVRLYKGATIDLNKWDGSDFFFAEATFEIIVTKKVAELLKKSKITNLNLINVSESEVDVEMWDDIEKNRSLRNII